MSTTIVRKTIRHAAPLRKHTPRAARAVPPLVNGDALSADEFLRRYEAMPEIKKAELIDGIVYVMASPVNAVKHGDPDNLLQGVFFNYSFATPGVRASTNATARLGPKNTPQPDLSMRYLPERSGREQYDKKGYLNYRPELVVEIAASSVAIDAHKKRDAYLAAGIPEYILWCTVDNIFRWWFLKDGAYHPIPIDADGIMRSRVFPGLWLDPENAACRRP